MDRYLGGVTLAGLPAWGLLTACHPRLRRDWAERWGRSIPGVQPGSIWLHAASVGEVRSAEGLLPLLPRPVLWTADTDTGAALARRIAAGEAGIAAGVRPVDHPWIFAPAWAEARPRAVIFVEGTFWPALAWRARRAGVPVLRLGAKAGRRTRALGVTGILRWWWRPTDAVLARDPVSAAWLEAVQDAPVTVMGDPKSLPRPPTTPVVRFPGRFVVGISTRDGDDEALLDAVPPGVRVLLAPRHLDRVGSVIAACEARDLTWRRRTALSGPRIPPGIDVVVLDTLGELQGCLPGASAAFVGGTFASAIGGHSPHAARAAGVPVVAGPHTHAQGDAFEGPGVIRVQSPAGLSQAMATAMEMSPVGTTVAADPDAVARVLDRWIGPVAPEASPRPWAWPLTGVTAGIASARNLAWDRGMRRPVVLPVPVISVGSTNARSPGRTSTTSALVAALAARGHTVGVALRGYRRRRWGRGVALGGDPADVGDEGALLARGGARVAASPDRVAAGRALVQAGVTVIVLDDGLQHRALHRDLDLVVVDARFPRARGLLPAGERREVHAVPPRGDMVLVHHSDDRFPAEGHAVIRRPGPWMGPEGPCDPPRGPVVAFAGIGRPADFLASLDLRVAAFRPLADHQWIDARLAAELLAWAGDRPLVCTAKDAVRLPPVLARRCRWRGVEVVLPDALLRRLPLADAGRPSVGGISPPR